MSFENDNRDRVGQVFIKNENTINVSIRSTATN